MGKNKSGISIIGSLNPGKKCQDRVRVLSAGGSCQSLRATDYKDPPKIIVVTEKDKHSIGFL